MTVISRHSHYKHSYLIISRYQYHLFRRLMLTVHANRIVNIKLDTAFLKGGILQWCATHGTLLDGESPLWRYVATNH